MNAPLTERAEGYVLELGYRHSYHAELSPGLLRFACLAEGLAPPAEGRILRYLEPAFGQGLSLNVHAAAQPGEYFGFDINPAHVANAQALAKASGSGVSLSGDSFEEFLAREGTEDFDLIAMHGTWSWISAANRHRVVEIARRRLAPGGLLYLSYNTWPGWAIELPLRHLFHQHAERASPALPLAGRIEASLAFAQAMKEAGAKFFKANPQAGDALQAIRKRDRHYVAHEYFNRDWHPMPFSQVCDMLSAAGLEFAGPVHDAGRSGLPETARSLLDGLGDLILEQTALDYFVNRTFRRDLLAKNARKLPAEEREAKLRATRVVLVRHPDRVPLGACIDAAANVARALADAKYAPVTLGELAEHPACAEAAFEELVNALRSLIEAGSVHPAQVPDSRTRTACKALNERLLQSAGREDEAPALASPVTGAGVFVAGVELLFLQALAQGAQPSSEWAAHARRSLEGADAARLASDAEAFARFRLPVLRALEVA